MIPFMPLLTRFAWPLVAGALVFALGFAMGDARRARADSAAKLEAVEVQRETTRMLNKAFEKRAAEMQAAHRHTLTERDRVIAGLRNRPTRVLRPAGDSQQCVAATGDQLAREDGEFLVGEATAHQQVAEQLLACQAILMEIKERHDAARQGR